MALEASGDLEVRRVRTKQGPYLGSTRQRDEFARVEEIGRISLEGASANPDLFSYGGQIGIGLLQEHDRESYDGQHQGHSAEGPLADFDLHAELFKSSKVSGQFFGVQTYDRYPRPFLPSLRERRTDYGAHWTYNDDVLPMELSLEHHETDRDGARRDNDNERVIEDLLRYTATWNASKNHTLRLDYEYDDIDERYSGTPPIPPFVRGGDRGFRTRRSQIRAEDSIQFGDSNQHRLDSVIRYQNEAGDLARDLFEAGPRLTLQHTPNFSTYYQYQFSREQVGQLDVEQQRGDIGFVHQLFTNLTTTANLFGLKENTGDVRTEELGGTIDWAYVRNNPLGVFTADLGLTHEDDRTRGGGTRVQLGESATFRDPLPIILYRPDVFWPSIVVWNSTRTRRYRIGFDYFVTQSRGRTLLERSPLGVILNNQSLSIDYIYHEDRNAKRDTTRADFRVQQAFKNGITPYYALETRHEDRDVSFGTPQRANDLDRHRVGVKYQQPRYAMGIELEVLKDNVDPFVAYRAFAERNLIRSPRSALDARLDFSQYFFDRSDRPTWWSSGGNRDTVLLEGSLDGRTAWTQHLSGYGRARWRYEDDRSRGVTHGVGLESGTELRWGHYTLSATIEYDLLHIVASRETGVSVWFKLRRDFSDLLGRK